jgi:hypothetical protein
MGRNEWTVRMWSGGIRGVRILLELAFPGIRALFYSTRRKSNLCLTNPSKNP